MTLVRKAAEALFEIRTRTRQELEDQVEDPMGGLLPAAGNEFSDNEINRSINDAIVFHSLRRRIACPADAVLATDHSYVEDSAATGDALPATVGHNAILHVEVVDGNSTREVFPVELKELEQYQNTAISSSNQRITDTFHYALLSDSTLENRRIKVRPQGLVTLRIWHVAPPVITSADGDEPVLSMLWARLLSLHAAISLLGRSGRASSQQIADYQAWLVLFDQASAEQVDDDRIRFPQGFWPL